MLSIIFGLVGGKPKHYCVYCDSTECGIFENFVRDLEFNKRTDLLSDKNFSKERVTLFPSISNTSYVISFLHAKLRIVPLILEVIEKEAIKHDIQGVTCKLLNLK